MTIVQAVDLYFQNGFKKLNHHSVSTFFPDSLCDIYFPWHRHPIEGINGNWCIFRKTQAMCERNRPYSGQKRRNRYRHSARFANGFVPQSLLTTVQHFNWSTTACTARHKHCHHHCQHHVTCCCRSDVAVDVML